MAISPRAQKWALALYALAAASVAFNLLVLQPTGGEQSADGSREAISNGLETAAIVAAEIAEGEALNRTASAPVRQRLIITPPGARDTETIRAIQSALAARGYETGGVDGVAGQMTEAAILAFEVDNGMMLTAEPSESLLHTLQNRGQGPTVRARLGTEAPGPKAEALIRFVQLTLATLGYAPGAPDGRLGPATVAAVRAFEKQQGLADTGRISGELVARLNGLSRKSRVSDAR